MTHTLALLGLATALVAGCTTASTSGSDEPPAVTDLITRVWVKGPKDEGTTLRGCTLQLSFDPGGSLEGRTNGAPFTGKFSADGNALTITDVDFGPGATDPASCRARVGRWLASLGQFSVQGMRAFLSEGQSGDPTGSAVELSTGDAAASTLAPLLIGLTSDHAERIVQTNNLDYRVIEVDGKGEPYTLDLRWDRINVKVKSGVVITADVG